MAETWQIILWVIVAAAILILIFVAIAIFLVCRKRNRRKKNAKHQRFEWERKDQTDSGKRKVYFDASSGEAKIFDQTDSGEKSSQKTKLEYNAKSKEARVLGVGDNKGFEEEKKVETSGKEKKVEITGKENNDEKPRTQKFNDFQRSADVSGPSTSHMTKESKTFSETYKSKETEVRSANVDKSKDNYVKLEATPVQRERLQPIEMVPKETMMTSSVSSKNVTSQGALKSYTNVGYSHAGQNRDLMSNVQFQQPVAVIKAFVNARPNTARRQARTLSRNYSRLNYKKSYTTSTTPRRKPLLYTWSVRGNDSQAPQSLAKFPIKYQEIHPYADRRRTTKHRSSTRSRSFTRRSLRRQREKQYDSLNGIYITNSRPPPFNRENTKSSMYYQRSMRPRESHYIANTDRSAKSYGSSKAQEISKSDRRNYGDFYEESYKMVKKSEFPAFQASSSKYEGKKSHDIEPEISSIVSGSEFSEFLTSPPRPSDSQSDGSTEGYSRGSYKAYKSSLEKSSKGTREVSSQSTSQQDREKHTKSFQKTLESLRNGDRKRESSEQSDVASPAEATSPWVNNDTSFRKQHGVPISGVAVLPPKPVFIQVEDSDQSDRELQKTDETD